MLGTRSPSGQKQTSSIDISSRPVCFPLVIHIYLVPIMTSGFLVSKSRPEVVLTARWHHRLNQTPLFQRLTTVFYLRVIQVLAVSRAGVKLEAFFVNQ